MTERDRLNLLADVTLLRDTDVAKLLGVGRSSVWRAVAEGSIPAPVELKGVKGKRWKLSDLRNYVGGLK